MKQLQSIPISNPAQVEIMRHIYNQNIESLGTKPLPYRNYEDQQQWWNANKHVLQGCLYEHIDRPGETVGFLVLRDRGGFYTPIIALQREDWGKGYGKEIVNDYIQKANGPMAGSQLKSNTTICHMNKKVGWRILGEREEETGMIELLIHPGPDPQREIVPEVFERMLDYLELTSVSPPKPQA